MLSDSVDHLAESQTSGDLGAVTILEGQSGERECAGQCLSRGVALLEIIRDLAPGAQLYFATALGSPVSFAKNILDLRSAGCDIIVDDVEYFNESPFQDGVIAQAVNSVTEDGALYFAAAGNDGNLNDGTASVWEGDFAYGGEMNVGGIIVTAHTFGLTTLNTVTTKAGGSGTALLFWSDPLGGSANDYDLYLLSHDGSKVLARSDNVQNGNQDPFEKIDRFNSPAFVNAKLLIVLKQGEPRFLRLEVINGALSIAANGRIRGHSAAVNAFSIAATPAAKPYGPAPNPIGPFPNLFNSLNFVERFSSDGPRRVFYNADGTPITPGNFLSSGGAVREKPDFTGADGVETSFPRGSDLNPFYGTSAAAAHVDAAATGATVYSTFVTLVVNPPPASACTYVVSPRIQSFEPAVGVGEVTVDTGTNCRWTAVSQASWITVTLGGSSVNDGRVNYLVAKNTGPARSGVIQIAGQSFTVIQEGIGAAGKWSYTGSMNAPRWAHTATLLPNGGVLVTGGVDGNNVLSGAEIYNPMTGAWSKTESLRTARRNHTATLIRQGGRDKVLVAGGFTAGVTYPGSNGLFNQDVNAAATRAAELYDVITGRWETTPSLDTTARGQHTATLLQDGKVLVAGGNNGATLLSNSELYDPANTTDLWTEIPNKWTDPTGKRDVGHTGNTATLLQNGKVLVVFGFGEPDSPQIFDPSTKTWSRTSANVPEIMNHAAERLLDGRVLITGCQIFYSLFLYTPSSDSWIFENLLNEGRSNHTSTLLPVAGQVLLAGGNDLRTGSIKSAELYDPYTGVASFTDSMNAPREYHTATRLTNGKILVAGGASNSQTLSSAEV